MDADKKPLKLKIQLEFVPTPEYEKMIRDGHRFFREIDPVREFLRIPRECVLRRR